MDSDTAILSSFTDLFNSDSLKDLTTDVSDTSIDVISSSIDEGAMFYGIPLFSIINGIYKTYKQVDIARTMKKYAVFLFEAGNHTTQKERRQFIIDYTIAIEEPDGIEVLISYLQRIDNINKIKIYCKLMQARVNELITIEEFIRLEHILERVPFIDLRYLRHFQSDNYLPGASESLYSVGLLYESVIEAGRESKYRLSVVGQQMLHHGLGIFEDKESKSFLKAINVGSGTIHR